MSEADVEQYEIDEQPEAFYELDDEIEPEDDTRGELIKFAFLAVVLLGTALVIGLLRPYIFNQIVPAILGENQPAATIINTEAEGETLKPEAAGPATTPETTPEEAEDAGEEAAPVGEEPVNPEDFPTAVPPSQTHTVQPGENLTAIARQYGVTVQALVDTNKITNPDRVDAGTILTIPDG
ncbi:MAG: LysM peptidoglycan-binding domain-containing protein [Ardenticatenaceae bacterium]|nr:LysM peptidoglycan-binding domain-containing protein [Anaerolineales bacterium]MCB8938604.1 LysM peptidoglycan-binding domain-containing protein [Ardenticatenaceae bacterium]MCB8973737.1 LysM peptidoglycan-binding domain-containing protein [Ardenticatenaceae bacterium]